MDMLAIKESKD